MDNKNLFTQLMEVIMETDAGDIMIDAWVRRILLADNDDNNEDDLENPMTADGSRIRKVKRTDYSRGKKEMKPSEGKVDPRTFLKWMLWIQDLEIRDPTSRNGKRFRNLFRLPFSIFEAIVDSCKNTGDSLFVYGLKDCTGEYSIPIEVKIMFTLRVLAGGTKIADAAELSGFMSNSEGNRFFKKFVVKFALIFEHIHIRPLEGDELLRSMATYARLGIPGAAGSVDCTFIPWGRVPADMHNLCDGDKGVGALFEVVVTHEKLACAVGGFFGATISDKISVKYSEYVEALRQKVIATDVKYKIRTGLGEEDFIEIDRIFLIADGGYLHWPEIICGFPYSNDPFQYKFTDWLASVRKDVECFFGILKQRFQYFQRPSKVQTPELLRSIFVTACILHNMILRHDGLNNLWENDINWSRLNADGDEIEEDNGGDEVVEGDDYVNSYLPVRFDRATFQPVQLDQIPPMTFYGEVTETEREFLTLRDLLSRHLHYTYATGNLRWPKVRRHCVEEGVDLNEMIRVHFPGAGDDIEEELV